MTNNLRPIFQDLLTIQEQMNSLFGDISLKTQNTPPPSESFSPPVDIYETAGEVILVAEVPGMKEDEVELEITDNLLTLKGDRKLERGSPEDSIHFLERSHGSFVRTFTLPGTVQQDKAKATLKHGLLKVVLPKVKVASL